VLTGCWALGALYVEGNGVVRDAVKGAALTQRGCNGGEMQACLNLANMYARGIGVARDDAKAAALRKKACADSETRGCSNTK